MFSWNKIINVLKRRRGNVNPFTTFKPFGWKCCKTIGSYFSCVFIEIWSTWEVWRALKKLELVSKLPVCFVCRWTHADLRTIVNFHIRTSMPLLDSYATIGIKKKTCFTLRIRERQADKDINWMTVVYRNEKMSHALRWIGISCSDSKKERNNFYHRIFFLWLSPRTPAYRVLFK